MFASVRLQTSKYRGVSWNADARKWRAQAQEGGRLVTVGFFDTQVGRLVGVQMGELTHRWDKSTGRW